MDINNKSKSNFRIIKGAELVNNLEDVVSLLDVGCRDSSLEDRLDSKIEYFGCDLFQNDKNSVDFVGDVLATDFGRKFNCVVALDIIEHVDDPHALIDRLLKLSDSYLIVSLPNIYEIKHKFNFIFKSSLGAKYRFGIKNSLDRHRWVMSYDEINEFYSHFADKNNLGLSKIDVMIGLDAKNLIKKVGSWMIRRFFSRTNSVRTVFAVFKKKT